MGKSLCVVCGVELGFMDRGNKVNGDPACTKCTKEKISEQKELEEAGKEEVSQRDQELIKRTNDYKPHWAKNGIIQFKNERIAILKRALGTQVQFIIAFDDLTKEGYQLKAIDEGRSADAGGFSGGIASYYYFQKH